MQRVAVVVAVAHLEVVDVDEAEQAEHAREQPVQPLGPEHRAMSELVDRRALEEGAHHAVRHQRQREQRPQLRREQQPRQRAGRGPQQQVADAVQAAAPVATPHQLAQQCRLHRRPVPLDPESRAAPRPAAGSRRPWNLPPRCPCPWPSYAPSTDTPVAGPLATPPCRTDHVAAGSGPRAEPLPGVAEPSAG